MKMDSEDLEARFLTFLDSGWQLTNVTPFLLTYLRLLLLFKSELDPATLSAVLERQKQLRGEQFEGGAFAALRDSSRRAMSEAVGNDARATRDAALRRMLFCALLDTGESDFFYLVEPIFEFVRQVRVAPDQLREVLETEFLGFKAVPN